MFQGLRSLYREGRATRRPGRRSELLWVRDEDGRAWALRLARGSADRGWLEEQLSMHQEAALRDPQAADWLLPVVDQGQWQGRAFLVCPWLEPLRPGPRGPALADQALALLQRAQALGLRPPAGPAPFLIDERALHGLRLRRLERGVLSPQELASLTLGLLGEAEPPAPPALRRPGDPPPAELMRAALRQPLAARLGDRPELEPLVHSLQQLLAPSGELRLASAAALRSALAGLKGPLPPPSVAPAPAAGRRADLGLWAASLATVGLLSLWDPSRRRAELPPASCGEGLRWVEIPAGELPHFSYLGDGRSVGLRFTEPYRLMDTELTQAEARDCGEAQWGATDMPVTQASYLEARHLCSLVGGRLPTVLEWRFASQGLEFPPGGRGVEGQPLLVAQHDWLAIRGLTLPVRSSPPLRWGLYDMLSNAPEWLLDQGAEHSWSPVAEVGAVADPEGRAWLVDGPQVWRGAPSGEATGAIAYPRDAHGQVVRQSRKSDWGPGAGLRCARGPERPTLQIPAR